MLRRPRLTKSSRGRFAGGGKARPVPAKALQPVLSSGAAPDTESAAPIQPKAKRRGVSHAFSFPAALQGGKRPEERLFRHGQKYSGNFLRLDFSFVTLLPARAGRSRGAMPQQPARSREKRAFVVAGSSASRSVFRTSLVPGVLFSVWICRLEGPWGEWIARVLLAPLQRLTS